MTEDERNEIAGSISGLILAQALAAGSHPDALERRMRRCWVDLLDIRNLLKASGAKDAGASRFTDAVVQEIIASAVQVPQESPCAASEPIALWVTMTNLDGVPYVIDFQRKGRFHAQASTMLYALDYKDCVPFLLSGNTISMAEPRMVTNDPGGAAASVTGTWDDAVEAARASSAFPIAFPSRSQKRNLRLYPGYRTFKLAVEDDQLAAKSDEPALHPQAPLPDEATFQFADGGLFNNEPIGRCIDAVAYLNKEYPERDPHNKAAGRGKVGRSFVIIEPDPQLPQDVARSLSPASCHGDRPAMPHSLLAKVLSAYFNDALYGDFRTAADTNRRIRDLETALQGLERLGLETARVEALKTEIRNAAGLQDKTEITLQRIPLSLPATKRLAGAFAGHFGGFLRKDYREADFLTGRHEARQWFAEWLRLWLGSHAEDIGTLAEDISPGYVDGLVGSPPPDPATTPIAPTGLTPVQLAASGWFPARNDCHTESASSRAAALTKGERTEIVELAEARGEDLVDIWLHASPFGHFGVHVVLGVIEHVLNGHFIDEPAESVR